MDFVLQGGLIMIPLLVCSILSLTIIIERFFSLRKSKIFPKSVLTLVDRGETDLSSLKNNFKTSPLPSILRLIQSKQNNTYPQVLEEIELNGRQAVSELRKGLVVLEIIAVVSPLLGLLGTVIGMVDVFEVVAKEGLGQAQAFSAGISKALVTTIAGLGIAIPTLVAHGYFVKKVETFQLDLEYYAHRFFQQIIADRKPEN